MTLDLQKKFQEETGIKKGKTVATEIEYFKNYCKWLVDEYINISWVPFYFEGNEAWGWIDSIKEWRRIQDAYKDTGTDPLKAKRNPNNEKDAFGFYSEYIGFQTLDGFAERNKMNLRDKIEAPYETGRKINE